MELYEWSKQYIKFKDCMKKLIQETIYDEPNIIAKEKNRTITYRIYEDLEEGIQAINNTQEILVTNNTKHNFDVLLNQWNVLRKNERLTIIFAHPKSNQKWLIHPKTHHKITEEKKLKEGLKTLFESIARV